MKKTLFLRLRLPLLRLLVFLLRRLRLIMISLLRLAPAASVQLPRLLLHRLGRDFQQR